MATQEVMARRALQFLIADCSMPRLLCYNCVGNDHPRGGRPSLSANSPRQKANCDPRRMPPRRHDIDRLLDGWPYRPGEVLARIVKAADGREVLQMRVDMGILQLEMEDRPDGTRPHGAASFFEYLRLRSADDPAFMLSPEQCLDADREFVQYYHRRICWLALREYRRAAQDADHSLSFMDLVRERSPDEEWTMSHEQYRPFVLFHRVQAGALAEL